jgi:hypothetical protein
VVRKKRTFTAAERWAVYTVHGEKCYIDNHMIDLQSMQVDHILPESLLDDPTELAEVLETFGLPQNFNLNSYENWLPTCPQHNNLKRAIVFTPSPLVQIHLQQAAAKADRARDVEKQTISDIQLSRALNMIERAVDIHNIDPEILKPLLVAFVEARQNAPEDKRLYRGAWITKSAPFRLEERSREQYLIKITPSLSIQFDDARIIYAANLLNKTHVILDILKMYL